MGKRKRRRRRRTAAVIAEWLLESKPKKISHQLGSGLRLQVSRLMPGLKLLCRVLRLKLLLLPA